MFAIEKILLLDNNNEKKNPEKSVAFLVGIAIYGNPIIITSDRSVVLCVTELFSFERKLQRVFRKKRVYA